MLQFAVKPWVKSAYSRKKCVKLHAFLHIFVVSNWPGQEISDGETGWGNSCRFRMPCFDLRWTNIYPLHLPTQILTFHEILSRVRQAFGKRGRKLLWQLRRETRCLPDHRGRTATATAARRPALPVQRVPHHPALAGSEPVTRVQPVEEKSTFVAALCSLILPGLGQVYDGKLERGFLIFIGTVIRIFHLHHPGALVWAFGIYDVYTIALQMNKKEIPFLPTNTGHVILFILLALVIVVVAAVIAALLAFALFVSPLIYALWDPKGSLRTFFSASGSGRPVTVTTDHRPRNIFLYLVHHQWQDRTSAWSGPLKCPVPRRCATRTAIMAITTKDSMKIARVLSACFSEYIYFFPPLIGWFTLWIRGYMNHRNVENSLCFFSHMPWSRCVNLPKGRPPDRERFPDQTVPLPWSFLRRRPSWAGSQPWDSPVEMVPILSTIIVIIRLFLEIGPF